ncbi:MAG: hypothetical protein ACNA8W_26465 [Bradymonadaceae bacterium]
MIRTRIVELDTLDAVAFRRKLKGARTAIIIQSYDGGQPGQALLNKNTGAADIAANTQRDRFPEEAFQEAVELTRFLPFTSRGQVKIHAAPKAEEVEAEEEDDAEEVATVCSKEYAAIVDTYTNKKGELSYKLLNKDFIQFAKGSSLVADMVNNGASVEEILDYIVKVKLENLTGNEDLSDAQVHRIVEMLNDVSPRNVFREVTDEIRKLLAR